MAATKQDTVWLYMQRGMMDDWLLQQTDRAARLALQNTTACVVHIWPHTGISQIAACSTVLSDALLAFAPCEQHSTTTAETSWADAGVEQDEVLSCNSQMLMTRTASAVFRWHSRNEAHLLTATNSMRKLKAAWQLAWVGSMAANGKTAAHLAALCPFVGSFWKS